MKYCLMMGVLILSASCAKIDNFRQTVRDNTLCDLSPKSQAYVLEERKRSGVTYDLEVYCEK